jgi:acyl-CoA thioesterase
MVEAPQISFVELMSLERLKGHSGNQKDPYISRVPAFNPGFGSAFGGHVFAQAVWAASQTVNEGMVVHVSLGWSAFFVDCPGCNGIARHRTDA